MKEYNFDVDAMSSRSHHTDFLESKTNIKIENSNFYINSNVQESSSSGNCNPRTKQSINETFSIYDIISINVYPGKLCFEFIRAWIISFVVVSIFYIISEPKLPIQWILILVNLYPLVIFLTSKVSGVPNYKIKLNINEKTPIKFLVTAGIREHEFKKFLHDIKELNPDTKINNYNLLNILIFLVIIAEIILVSLEIIRLVNMSL